MKILISPAKKVNENKELRLNNVNEIIFFDKTQKIIAELRSKSRNDLMKLMNLSESLSSLNYQRNQMLGKCEGEYYKAIQVFAGEVYRGLDYFNMSEKAKNYTDNNLLILSGLYGIIRPNDAIQAYRLEMGTKIEIDHKMGLYEFWKEDILLYLNQTLNQSELLLNLASDEYSKVVEFNKLKNIVVSVNFFEKKEGNLKKVMVYLKQARGTLARQCAENNIQSVEEIKNLRFDGYEFYEKKSNDNQLVFIR